MSAFGLVSKKGRTPCCSQIRHTACATCSTQLKLVPLRASCKSRQANLISVADVLAAQNGQLILKNTMAYVLQ